MKELYDKVNESLKDEYDAKITYASLAVSMFLGDDVEDLIYGPSTRRIDDVDDYIIYMSMDCDKQEIDRYMHSLHVKYPECREFAIKQISKIRYAICQTKAASIIWWTNLPTTIFDNTDKQYRNIITEKLQQFKDDIVIDRIYSSFVNDHIQRAKGYDRESTIVEIYCNNSITEAKVKEILFQEFGGYENTY